MPITVLQILTIMQRRKSKKEQRGLLLLLEDGGNTQEGVLISLPHSNFQRQLPARTSDHYFPHNPPYTIHSHVINSSIASQ